MLDPFQEIFIYFLAFVDAFPNQLFDSICSSGMHASFIHSILESVACWFVVCSDQETSFGVFYMKLIFPIGECDPLVLPASPIFYIHP